jgi:hypothetical protein
LDSFSAFAVAVPPAATALPRLRRKRRRISTDMDPTTPTDTDQTEPWVIPTDQWELPDTPHHLQLEDMEPDGTEMPMPMDTTTRTEEPTLDGTLTNRDGMLTNHLTHLTMGDSEDIQTTELLPPPTSRVLREQMMRLNWPWFN